MKEQDGESAPGGGRLEVADLADALELMKADASRFLKDLLNGVSMWATTAVMAFFLAIVWLALAQIVLTFAHPYGSPPLMLDILYLSYTFAVVSASLGFLLSWRYYSLRRKYTRLFEIASKLR
jgi:hypothetical protein